MQTLLTVVPNGSTKTWSSNLSLMNFTKIAKIQTNPPLSVHPVYVVIVVFIFLLINYLKFNLNTQKIYINKYNSVYMPKLNLQSVIYKNKVIGKTFFFYFVYYCVASILNFCHCYKNKCDRQKKKSIYF